MLEDRVPHFKANMDKTDKRASQDSAADSTHSGASNYEKYEAPRKSMRSTYMFGAARKSRQSMGAYTSLFARKLLPPLGFYREADKYNQLKIKFQDDPYKLDALDEMWQDYKKYQIRKRFRWPPHVICRKFFWTTGYYADYQKLHRATKLRKPGEDSSEEEMDVAGQFMVAGAGNDDINVQEFERYREAKKQGVGVQKTRFEDGDGGSEKLSTSPRLSVDFGGKGKPQVSPKVEEEVETIVEYTLIRDPNKKRKSAASKNKKGRKSKAGDFNFLDVDAGPKIVTKKTSISTTDPITGLTTVNVKESTEKKK